ncbi:D-alanyl-D-alanine carboxypeptidase [Neisseriaceae bacterium PsAf]|nr:D-alanyl-D-alanine carboxypeptidase [Neisseriaceae bacterium PsAf]
MRKIFSAIPILMVATSIQAIDLPKPPDILAKAYLVYDMQSNQILTGKDLDKKIEPASLTKLMTAYLSFQQLKQGQLQLDQQLTVSEKAYKAEGSRMFLELSKTASVDDVLKGLIVQSGNDAAITLAETISGSEATFANLMNQESNRLGMQNTHFENSTGLPGANHYTSPRDLLILSSAIIQDYPEYYPYYSIKEFTYNKIKQNNRNLLLYRDPTVDGLKTGHTSSAGYNLVASSIDEGRRLIAIVIGTDSDKTRLAATSNLLNWGRNAFVNQKIFDELQKIRQVRVYKGKPKELSVGFLKDTYISIPVGSEDKITQEVILNEPVVAPVERGQVIGKLLIKIDAKTFQELPLLALQEIKSGGFFRRFWDSIVLFFK